MSKIFSKCPALILSCCLMGFGFPGQSVGICALVDSIIHTTGLSRNVFSAIYAFSTVTGCFLILSTSQLADKFGLRRCILAVLAMWTLLLFVVGNADACYFLLFKNFLNKQLYFVFFLYLGISFLRFFGQNMLPVLGRMQIVRAFDKHQGMMASLNGVFISISTGLAPRIMHFLSKDGIWCDAYKALAIVGLLFFVSYYLLCREDSFKENISTGDAAPTVLHELENFDQITRKKLLKMPIFWCLMLALSLNSFIGSGSTVHIVDIFRENGAASSLAVNSYLYLSFATIMASFVFGRQMDKGRVKGSLIALLLCQFFGLVGLEMAGTAFGLLLYIIGIGASWGGYAVLMAVGWAKVFGKKNLGLILGVAQFFSSMMGAVSVFLMSLAKSVFGSYFVLMHCIEFVILGLILIVAKKLSFQMSKIK